MVDKSHGYEAIAEEFTRARNRAIGPTNVRAWAERLTPGATVLDVACGFGVPISEALLDMGFVVYGIDASETLLAKFRERFPHVPLECSPVEDSSLFHRTFEAVVAWGLVFLLPAQLQRRVIATMASALDQGGHLLFTAPQEPCSWMDGMTGLPSLSLGHDEYARQIEANGLDLIGNDEDEGRNYYYFAEKR